MSALAARSAPAEREVDRAPVRVALALVILLMYGVVQDPTAAAALIVIAAVTGAASQVATVTLLAATALGGAGTAMALNGALMNLGSAAGGATGGVLLASGGFGALSVALPVFALATLALLVRSSPSPVAGMVGAPGGT